MNIFKRLRCKHDRVRCIHGDEINHANGRRVRCLDCERALSWELPERCFVTGKAHGGTKEAR